MAGSNLDRVARSASKLLGALVRARPGRRSRTDSRLQVNRYSHLPGRFPTVRADSSRWFISTGLRCHESDHNLFSGYAFSSIDSKRLDGYRHAKSRRTDYAHCVGTQFRNDKCFITRLFSTSHIDLIGWIDASDRGHQQSISLDPARRGVQRSTARLRHWWRADHSC